MQHKKSHNYFRLKRAFRNRILIMLGILRKITEFRSHACIILATRTFIKSIRANIAGGIVDNNS